MWETLGTIALNAGSSALAGLAVISVLLGWLIPRNVHNARVADLKQRADDYRAAWEAEKQVSATRAEQIAILLGARRENGK